MHHEKNYDIIGFFKIICYNNIERQVSKMRRYFGISNDPDDRSEDVKEPK
jgi:hypothetical protein